MSERARRTPCSLPRHPDLDGMFVVDEAAAEAIRRAYKEGGELQGYRI